VCSFLLQAAIAIAFCLGFLFGPTIGAMFSILGTTSEAQSYSTFQYPALFSLCMAAGDILLIYALLPETLPSSHRVRSTCCKCCGKDRSLSCKLIFFMHLLLVLILSVRPWGDNCKITSPYQIIIIKSQSFNDKNV